MLIDYPIAGPRFTEADARAIHLHHVEITEHDQTTAEGVALHLTGKPYLMIMPPGWEYTGDDSMGQATHTAFLTDIATVRYQPRNFQITWQTTEEHGAVVSAGRLAELLGIAPDAIDSADPLACSESIIEDTLAEIEGNHTFGGLTRDHVIITPAEPETDA